MTLYPDILLQLPNWVHDYVRSSRGFFHPRARMRFTIELARQNVIHDTGGPFGAAIFEKESGWLVAPGVNVVVPSTCSHAHAEMMAIGIAQQIAGTYDLGAAGRPAHELVTSSEPCAMCFGAIPWSGVRRVVCGARDEDARAIGFDEGPKPSDWVNALESREISVIRDVCREEAVEVFQLYTKHDGVIYNARQD